MKKILIVEGNLREENQNFSTSGIQTHTQSLQDSLANFTNELDMDVLNLVRLLLIDLQFLYGLH